MSEEKRNEIIHDALNYLDNEMLEDVDKLRRNMQNGAGEQSLTEENSKTRTKSMRKHWRKWTALAASICILIAGGWIYEVYLRPAEQFEEMPDDKDESILEQKENDIQSEGEEESLKQQDLLDYAGEVETPAHDLQEAVNTESLRGGVVIPQMEVTLKKPDGNVEVDMLGFFILNGRSYIQYEFQHDYVEKNADFVGEYVGHITGLVDEWTKADGYVDGAGTYTGDVYEVKGVSPEFMLCMVWEDGNVETFIHNNDITLYKGSDLVDDWLDLRGSFDTISMETIVNQQFVYKEFDLTEEEMEVFETFLDAFAEAGFVYEEEKLEHPFGGDMDTPDMMDFYFVKENGLRLRFRTLGDGYVSFPWVDACVQIEQDIYDKVVDILLQYAD